MAAIRDGRSSSSVGVRRYAMIGAPAVLLEPDPIEVLGAALGPYDSARWRFGHFDPASGAYREFPDVQDFAPGRGFWLIQREPVPIPAVGISVSSVTGAAIELEPGWNQIAHRREEDTEIIITYQFHRAEWSDGEP